MIQTSTFGVRSALLYTDLVRGDEDNISVIKINNKMEKLNYEQLIQWDKNDLAEYILNLYDKIQN